MIYVESKVSLLFSIVWKAFPKDSRCIALPMIMLPPPYCCVPRLPPLQYIMRVDKSTLVSTSNISKRGRLSISWLNGQYYGRIPRFYSVVVITIGSDPVNSGSNPDRTFF